MKFILKFKLFLLVLLASVNTTIGCTKDDGGDDGGSSGAQSVEKGMVLGINETELATWESDESVRHAKLDAMIAAGAQSVRFSLSSSSTDVLERVTSDIIYCNEHNLKVMLIIKTCGIIEFYEAGTQERDGGVDSSGNQRFWSVLPHSKIDSFAYGMWINTRLSYFKTNGAVVDVIEVGNEFAWVDFNGDLPVMPVGSGVVYDTGTFWSSIPEDVINGVRKVGEITALTKTEVQRVYGATGGPTVILGGLNYPSATWIKSVGGSLMTPELVMQIIAGTAPSQEDGLENYLDGMDGVGIHLYPYGDCALGDNESQEAYKERIKAVFVDFAAPINSVQKMPLYMTEFGMYISYSQSTDMKRYNSFTAFFDAVDDIRSEYDMKQLHLYSWSGDGYAILQSDNSSTYTSENIFHYYDE